jgi:hypothetical protein
MGAKNANVQLTLSLFLALHFCRWVSSLTALSVRIPHGKVCEYRRFLRCESVARRYNRAGDTVNEYYRGAMTCPLCHGRRLFSYQGQLLPCPECEGRGEIHCCDGLQEQPEETAKLPGNVCNTDTNHDAEPPTPSP